MIRTVVELDLIGYSRRARELEEQVGVQIVGLLNDQIQRFVDQALTAIALSRQAAVVVTTRASNR